MAEPHGPEFRDAANIAHLRFRSRGGAVSAAGVDTPLHPHTAMAAAIALEILRCRQFGLSPAGVTKGGTAHRSVIPVEKVYPLDRTSRRCLPVLLAS